MTSPADDDLMRRARWKEISVHEHAGQAGNPVRIVLSKEDMDL